MTKAERKGSMMEQYLGLGHNGKTKTEASELKSKINLSYERIMTCR